MHTEERVGGHSKFKNHERWSPLAGFRDAAADVFGGCAAAGGLLSQHRPRTTAFCPLTCHQEFRPTASAPESWPCTRSSSSLTSPETCATMLPSRCASKRHLYPLMRFIFPLIVVNELLVPIWRGLAATPFHRITRDPSLSTPCPDCPASRRRTSLGKVEVHLTAMILCARLQLVSPRFSNHERTRRHCMTNSFRRERLTRMASSRQWTGSGRERLRRNRRSRGWTHQHSGGGWETLSGRDGVEKSCVLLFVLFIACLGARKSFHGDGTPQPRARMFV